MADSIESQVIALIAKKRKLEPAAVTLDSTFEQLGVDSLDAADLLFTFEDTFGIVVPDEAAKSMKFGGLTHDEALKLVTLNPAIQLGIDKRVGTIDVGKDDDLVIYNHDPLSAYAVVQKTLIDGRVYFDRQKDIADRADRDKEKKALIDKEKKESEKKSEEKKPGEKKGEEKKPEKPEDMPSLPNADAVSGGAL